MFKRVSREQNRLRLALDGPAGSGKTYTALRFAFALAGPGGRVAVIDTEHGSAAKYEGEAPDGIPWVWDGVTLMEFSPSTYEQVIKEAGRQKYDVLVIDSLSHAWAGVGGALDQIDRSKDKNTFTAWKSVTPQHNALVEAILQSPCHVIVTMRSKMEYVIEEDEKGRKVPRKIGLKPIQREGVEYEFDLIGDLDLDHRLTVSKSRCSAVDGKIVSKPDALFLVPVKEWLFSGSPRKEPPPEPPPAAAPVVQPPPPPSSPASSAAVKVKLSNGRSVTLSNAAQADEIKRLWSNLGKEPEALRELLNAAGYQRIADMPRTEAEDLICVLETKDRERQAKEAF